MGYVTRNEFEFIDAIRLGISWLFRDRGRRGGRDFVCASFVEVDDA